MPISHHNVPAKKTKKQSVCYTLTVKKSVEDYILHTMSLIVFKFSCF